MRFVPLVILVAGCLETNLVPCGDVLCPDHTICIAGACASPADVGACAGKAEADPCSSEPDAFCHDGACRASICGDSFTSPDEVCDDGNRQSGDGCSDDCRSNEACGNGIVDFSTGEECDDGTAGLSGDGCTSTCLVEYDTWLEVTPKPIGDRFAHAMAYDARRDRIVTFGGNGELGFAADTWEYDGTNWIQRFTLSAPAARAGYAMAASPSSGVMMFGGTTSLGLSNETWTWDGTIWNQRTTGISPSPRQAAAMVLDTKRGRVVLFGGAAAGSAILGDTWSWDGQTWTQLAPGASPPARSNHAMAYDPARDRIVLMGGADSNGGRDDVWEFDGATWAPVTTGPPARSGHVMAYHAVRGTTVVFGGRSADLVSDLDDLWEWNGTTWVKDPSTVYDPGAREAMAAAYDGNLGALVINGGLNVGPFGVNQHYTDTFALTDAWAQQPGITSPFARTQMAFAYDRARGVGVLFGGFDAEGDELNVYTDTWEWDGLTWSLKVPATTEPPPPLSFDASIAVFDDALGQVVLYEPVGAGLFAWDGADWLVLAPPASPPTRHSMGLAYDAARDRIVLFGGATDTGDLADTWEFDGTTWIARTPVVAPPARHGHLLAYDARRKVVVLYGGAGFADTWEWDGTNWTDRTPASSPPERDSFTLVYEANRQRVLMFGGISGAQFFADTWEWDGLAWTQRAPVLSPSVRYATASIFDSVHGKVVMYGGQQFDATAQTWSYGFGTTADPAERCDAATTDSDHDGLAGCADPDCWGRCRPLCPPGTICAPSAPHCGDGTCSPVEDYLICPADCTPP